MKYKQKKNENRKGGWQVWVDFYPNYVIKTPKTKKEIKERIIPYLKSIGKTNEIEKQSEKMIEDMKKSIKIIKNNKIPKHFIGNAEFLKKGQIKQDRIISLEEYLIKLSIENKIKEAKKIIDKVIKTIQTLWKYGIHEKTFKFNQNFGIHNSKIILMDFLEITNNQIKVKKQLAKKPWEKIKDFEKNMSEKILDYWIEQANKNLTLKNLNKLWKNNLK